MSLPKPCTVAGCPEVVEDHSRCEGHRADREERRRERRGSKRYDRRDWRDRIRPRQLSREPLCEFCKEQGRIEPATEVDHIDGDPWNDDPYNLRSLCKPCHSGRTARDQTS